MGITINSKILLSVASIAAAAALVIGATFAFFSDEETSTGNTFTAGELDLKIDAQAHYAGLTCTDGVWVEDEEGQSTRPDLIGDGCDGTWSEKDLVAGEDKFFNLVDIKPGDSGENTISLHVYDNDAWARFVITDVSDLENTFLQAELDSNNDDGVTSGELQENLEFSIWLDEGVTDGFQCSPDPGQPGVAGCYADITEGDNVYQPQTEPQLASPGPLDQGGETHDIWTALALVYQGQGCQGSGRLDDGTTTCPGLNADGRLIASITYYFGLSWNLPGDVGNEALTDSLSATLRFDAVQHRNNPGQTF